MYRLKNKFHIVLLVMAACVGRGVADGEPRPDVNRWEKEIAAFESQDHSKPPPKHAILFVGSSSIRLWNLPKSFPGMDVINRGFGGSQIIDSVHYAQRIVVKYQPRMIVMYAGDNDIASGKSPEQLFADFKAFVETIRKELPETPIAYISIKPSILRWSLVEKMRQANQLIAAYCRDHKGLSYIDTATRMLGKDGKPRPELFAKDGLHLNDSGYCLWASIIKTYLEPPKPKAALR